MVTLVLFSFLYVVTSCVSHLIDLSAMMCSKVEQSKTSNFSFGLPGEMNGVEILLPGNNRLDRIRQRVNTKLKALCIEEGFGYICNDNITSRDLSTDDLHLSRNGQKILLDNILGSCCITYNPYLTDFYDQIL